ncbi:hypothetical protein [Bradyrhizobium sp. WYCCWR 12699]|uniref:hypothetical protein n=1 Tax=Bradyrhizobium sp. WYCCWR 12699 TaxID=3064203 RepID=UPI0028A3430E|nr:hypothetical protein [Bradyrhizobium sp. WYCCWR 12699]MDT4738419.1 hypothetical protein [Bradyrhizobium sp. WYCCWR 12699]
MPEVVLPLEDHTRAHWSARRRRFYYRHEMRRPPKGFVLTKAERRLGTNYEVAMQRAREINARIERYRAEQASTVMIDGPAAGTIAELFQRWKKHPTYRGSLITDATRGYYDGIMSRAERHELRCSGFAGMKFADVPIRKIDVLAVRQIVFDYADLGLNVSRADAANRFRDTMRTIWNAMAGEFPGIAEHNPWPKARKLKHVKKKTRRADLVELAYLYRGSKLKDSNLGVAAWAMHEFQIRSGAILSSWLCQHWKPADRPFQVYVIRPKTENSRWIDLRDENGEPLYPGLEAEIDRIKGTRSEGILIPRDGTYDTPWALPGKKMPGEFYVRFGEVRQAGGLGDDIKWTSYRHGGISESAEAGCTEQELMAISGHLDPRTAQRYIHETQLIVTTSQRKRLAHRARILQLLLANGRLESFREDPQVQVLFAALTPYLTQETEIYRGA